MLRDSKPSVSSQEEQGRAILLQRIDAALVREGIDDAAVRESMIVGYIQAAREIGLSHGRNAGSESPFPEVDRETWALCLQVAANDRQPRYRRAFRYSFISPEGAVFADVSAARLKRETGFYGYPGGKTRGFITRLPVADFLELTTPDDVSIEKIQAEAGRFDPASFDDSGNYLPYLDIDPETGQVIGHEGRHRAAALRAAGATDMPVVISVKNPLPALSVTVLKGQAGRGAAVLGETAPIIDGGEEAALRVANRQQPVAPAIPAPPFYSALIRAIEALRQNVATPDQWRGIVGNLANKGVKRDEIEWTGLLEWLDLQEGRIAKGVLLDYLRENSIRIEEVVLGTRRRVESVPSGWAVIEPDGEVYSIYGRPDEARAVAEHGSEPTMYAKHTLPGGVGYRELLLTLPDRDREREAALRALDAAEERYTETGREEDYRAVVHARNVVGSTGGLKREFLTRHFNGRPNVLAHVRFNDRIDAEGRRVLFIEEFQSDWGQQGKKRGFDDHRWALLDSVREHRVVGYFEGSKEAADAEAARRSEELEVLGWGVGGITAVKSLETVPVAPFVTKTESWVSLILKRMVRYAAEHGFEAVAWTTGEQAERYDLSKEVDSVLVKKEPNGLYAVWADREDELSENGRAVYLHQSFAADKLPEVIGKELAERAINDLAGKALGESVEYSGLDLKVGGAGMNVFYNNIVPQVANDLLKKIGGGRVGPVKISTDLLTDGQFEQVPMEFIDEYGSIPVCGFEMTDAMREKALAGLPLFMQFGDRSGFPGMTPDSLRREIDKLFGNNFTQGLLDTGAFRMLRRERELPAHLQHPRGGIAGVYDDLTDKTYLVAEWIRPDMVKGMMLHEVGVHYGMARILGDRAQELFAQARELVRQGDPAAVAAFLKVPPDTNPAIVNEEILAYLVGEYANRKMSIVQRATSKAKGFLFEMGADIDLTPADMTVMAEGCLKRCANAGKRPAFSLFSDVAMLAKRAALLLANPLPDRLRNGGARYSFAGTLAATGDRSLLAEAVALARPLTSNERARYHALEDRYDTLNEEEKTEYERLSFAVDVQFDPDLVRQKTGWFQGYDGQWRFELDDSEAKLLMSCGEYEDFQYHGGVTGLYPNLRLDEILHHPKLFEAYPALRDIEVYYDPIIPEFGERAYYRHQQRLIGLSTWNRDPDKTLSSLMHEVQHAIQFIEGFALGGSVSDFQTKSNAFDMFNDAHRVYLEIKETHPELVAAWESVRDYRLSVAKRHGIALFDDAMRTDQQAYRKLHKALTADEKAEFDRLMEAYGGLLDDSDAVKRFTDALGKMHWASVDQHGVGGVIHQTPYEQYQRLAGEIEARDVQARLGLLDEPVRHSESVDELGAAVAVSHAFGEAEVHQPDAMAANHDHQPFQWLPSSGETRRTVRPYSSQGIPNEEVILRFGKDREKFDDAAPDGYAERLQRLERHAILALQRNDLSAGRVFTALMEAYAESAASLTRRCSMGTILLIPCAKVSGAWQVTWLGADGEPAMDSVRDGYREALEVFWSSAIPESDLEFTLDEKLKLVRHQHGADPAVTAKRDWADAAPAL